MNCHPPSGNPSPLRYSPRKSKKTGLHLPSRIKKDQVVVEGPMKRSDYSSTFESGIWKSTILPHHSPDSRSDVVLLDNWITERLAAVAQSQSAPCWDTQSAKIAQEQLKILDLGFSEVCRQVALDCLERSELMNRLWMASHEIYEKLLAEMTRTLDSLRSHSSVLKQKSDELQNQLDAQEWRHHQEMKRVESFAQTTKSEDSIVYREMQEEIFNREKDMRLMENILSDLSIWFPNFNAYSTSVLRKHLPPIEDCAGLLLRYGQSLGQNHEETVLPQDLLYQDLKRLEKLDIGFYVSGQSNDGGSRVSSRAGKDSSTGDSHNDPSAFRTLIFENQLQSVVVEELQNKYSALEEKSISQQKSSKARIDNLLIENYALKLRLEGQENVVILPNISLQIRGITNLSSEIVELWTSKKNVSLPPPSFLISVADLQKFFLQFSRSFISNLCPPCWTLHTPIKEFLGREWPSESKTFHLAGSYGGIGGSELKLMNCEILLSHFLIQQKKTSRLVKETLRRIVWSIWIWSRQCDLNPSEAASVSSRYQSIVDGLPRTLLEHEKGFILVLSNLFGFSRLSLDTETENIEIPTMGSGISEIYLSVYMRCFSAMKQELTFNPKATGIASSSSTNLFLTGNSCPVPILKIDKIISRIFSVSKPKASYRRPSSLETPDDEDDTLRYSSEGESWWTCIPSKVAVKIREECVLLSNKNAGVSAEAFDITLTVMSLLRDYRETLVFILEELYRYLTGSVGSASEPLFHSLLVFILEKKESNRGFKHKILPLQLAAIHAEDRLNPTIFANTILSQQIPLSGLHILFDAGPRFRRELRKEGESLFSELTSRFSGLVASDDDESISSDAIMRHAQLYFDTYAPPDLFSSSDLHSLIALSPDIYFSVQSMKFFRDMLAATGTLANFSGLKSQAKSSRFRTTHLLQDSFSAWARRTNEVKEQSDSDREDEMPTNQPLESLPEEDEQD